MEKKKLEGMQRGGGPLRSSKKRNRRNITGSKRRRGTQKGVQKRSDRPG